MSKYIDSEKLIAEIERYKQGAAIARFNNGGEDADYFQGKVDLCDDLKHNITSLQQEQPLCFQHNCGTHKIVDICARYKCIWKRKMNKKQ